MKNCAFNDLHSSKLFVVVNLLVSSNAQSINSYENDYLNKNMNGNLFFRY